MSSVPSDVDASLGVQWRNHESQGGEMGKNQHVVRRHDGWAVRGAGNSRDTSHHDTQSDAVDSARNTARRQRSEVVIHRPDGRTRDRDSYGNDPNPPTDRRH